MRAVRLAAAWILCAIAGDARASAPDLGGIVAEELASAVPRARDRAGVRLEGRVVRLSRERDARGVRVSAEVSLLLLEMPGGALRAILRGSAALSGPAHEGLEETVLRRAVRRALRPLRAGLPEIARRDVPGAVSGAAPGRR